MKFHLLMLCTGDALKSTGRVIAKALDFSVRADLNRADIILSLICIAKVF